MEIMNEEEWGDLECLYKVCQAAISDGTLFTSQILSWMNEAMMNENDTNENEIRNSRQVERPENLIDDDYAVVTSSI